MGGGTLTILQEKVGSVTQLFRPFAAHARRQPCGSIDMWSPPIADLRLDGRASSMRRFIDSCVGGPLPNCAEADTQISRQRGRESLCKPFDTEDPIGSPTIGTNSKIDRRGQRRGVLDAPKDGVGLVQRILAGTPVLGDLRAFEARTKLRCDR